MSNAGILRTADVTLARLAELLDKMADDLGKMGEEEIANRIRKGSTEVELARMLCEMRARE